MFLMPSAACCSDTSLSLGTTGMLVECCGRDWLRQGLGVGAVFRVATSRQWSAGEAVSLQIKSARTEKGKLEGRGQVPQVLRLQICCVVWGHGGRFG